MTASKVSNHSLQKSPTTVLIPTTTVQQLNHHRSVYRRDLPNQIPSILGDVDEIVELQNAAKEKTKEKTKEEKKLKRSLIINVQHRSCAGCVLCIILTAR